MGKGPSSPHFRLEKIEDENLREVLYNITRRLQENVFLGFNGKHIQIERTAGTWNIPHLLPFVPRDAWFTGITVPDGTVTVKFNYDLFTRTEYSITVTTSNPTAPVSIRGFIGRMKEEGF